jgi:hypothetical protein
MIRNIAAALALALLVACGQSGDAERVAQKEVPDEAASAAPSGGARPAFVELGPDELASPFSTDTVLKLNAIVQRSLETIQAYDKEFRAIRAAIGKAAAGDAVQADRAAAQAALARLEELSAAAASAHTDMNDAVEQLKGSGEKYNDALLAGMVDFVAKVDAEINQEKIDQTAALATAQ